MIILCGLEYATENFLEPEIFFLVGIFDEFSNEFLLPLNKNNLSEYRLPFSLN